MQELKKSPEITGPPSSMPYFAEVRIEFSPAEVVFSEPCFHCGSLKRRCLHPPPSPRKKLLVIEPSSESPSSSAGGRAVLSRSISSSSPAVAAAASLLAPTPTPTSPIPSSPFLRSNSFRPLPDPTDAGDRSPSAEVPFVYSCSNPITPMSPPAFLYDALPVRPVSKSPDHALICPAEKNKRDEEWAEESVIDEETKPTGRSEVRVSINCGCGMAREVVFHHDH
ncbi:uncharacterized protein [Typha latifolia]|uniref:uncharacterized protein n=1 Tax=Typha latifolia TaxID=4733 RepID=UPI003C2CB650